MAKWWSGWNRELVDACAWQFRLSWQVVTVFPSVHGGRIRRYGVEYGVIVLSLLIIASLSARSRKY
jgi:hypothetical protein